MTVSNLLHSNLRATSSVLTGSASSELSTIDRVPKDWHATLATAAAGEDSGQSHIAHSVAALNDAGYLATTALRPTVLFRRLVRIGQANLPLARLYEGHVNAVRLITTLGDDRALNALKAQTRDGVLLGVWGADGAVPLTIEGDSLVGGKRFASGLGVVGSAVVTVQQGKTVRLALIDVTEHSRHKFETWSKIGMRATASGDFDADGMSASNLYWIGKPGQYFEEPSFVGGVWRIAAVQLGGTLGLLHAAAEQLLSIGRLGAEQQIARLAPVLTRALAAGAFTERAAVVAEGPVGSAEPERAVSLSAQARLLTEEIGQDAIAAVERSVGLQHFDETAPTGRIARDLATYMRQAARDALLQRSGSWALHHPGLLISTQK